MESNIESQTDERTDNQLHVYAERDGQTRGGTETQAGALVLICIYCFSLIVSILDFLN